MQSQFHLLSFFYSIQFIFLICIHSFYFVFHLEQLKNSLALVQVFALPSCFSLSFFVFLHKRILNLKPLACLAFFFCFFKYLDDVFDYQVPTFHLMIFFFFFFTKALDRLFIITSLPQYLYISNFRCIKGL